MAIETYELNIEMSGSGGRLESVMHFKGDGVTANDTWESGKDLVAAFANNVEPLFLAIMAGSNWVWRYVTRRVHPRGLSTGYHLQYQFQAQSGTRTGSVVGLQTCPALRVIPGLGVKSAGRIFLPPITSDALINNQYQAGYLADVSSLLTGMIGPFNVGAANWNLVVYSRKLDTVSNVVSGNLSPRIGFQKRRRNFV